MHRWCAILLTLLCLVVTPVVGAVAQAKSAKPAACACCEGDDACCCDGGDEAPSVPERPCPCSCPAPTRPSAPQRANADTLAVAAHPAKATLRREARQAYGAFEVLLARLSAPRERTDAPHARPHSWVRPMRAAICVWVV